MCDLIVSTNRKKKKNKALCQKLSLGCVTGWTGRGRRDGLVLLFFQFPSNFCQTALQSAALHSRRHGRSCFRHLKSEGGVDRVYVFLSAASRRCFSVASLKRFLNMRSLRRQRPSSVNRLLLLDATQGVIKTLSVESHHLHTLIMHSDKLWQRLL